MSEYNRNNIRHDQLHTRKKKKSKGLIALLIVLVVLAVVVGGFAVVFSRYYRLTQYVSDSQIAKDLAALGDVEVESTGL